MDGEPINLTEKLGPLPYWEWALIGIAGWFIYSHFLHKPAVVTASSTDPVTDNGSDPNAVDDGSDLLGGSGSPGSGMNNFTGDTSGLSGLSTPTNQSWLLNAIDGLSGSEYGGAAANDALTNWLAGNPITADQYKIINDAINKYGAPPNPVPTIFSPAASVNGAGAGSSVVPPGGGIPDGDAGVTVDPSGGFTDAGGMHYHSNGDPWSPAELVAAGIGNVYDASGGFVDAAGQHHHSNGDIWSAAELAAAGLGPAVTTAPPKPPPASVPTRDRGIPPISTYVGSGLGRHPKGY